MSVWRRQIREVMRAPHRAILLMVARVGVEGRGSVADMRMRPYPPSFSRIAARIMEPAIGASTWALGSHRWKRNRGSLTRKAVFMKSHKSG